MNVSIRWLSALLDREIDPADAAHRLAMLGAPVDGVEALHGELDGVVIGRVERARPHPNADRLTLCDVADGKGVIEVVCGAPNVVEGKKYPYAPAGTVLPGGLKLTARKIRGVTSNGMLCSERELGLGTDQQGIMELDIAAEPGTSLIDALGLADTRLELDITANRPDLLCHRGVARELGASYGVPVKLEPIPGAPPASRVARRVERAGSVDGVEVVIEDVDGCPRYLAAVIRGVRIGPSPQWLQTRLRSIGARPINNVVDATNYILFELNQPLHAFDLANVRGRKIVVRSALDGECMTTLDGEQREFGAGMTLICDGEGPTAIAGLMGGMDSEVTDTTTDVLLECAYFDPKRIRATRKALKMSTDASYRFERGIDIQAMEDTLRRAVTLILAVAGGEEREGPIDVYPRPVKARSVFLRSERVAHVLGHPVSDGEVERLLTGIGFVVVPKQGRFAVQVPGWRPDVTREVDLVEEVARLVGYDAFPVELRPYRPSTVPDDPIEPLKSRLRRLMTSLGLNEARSLALVRGGSEHAATLANPMSTEETHLREDLLPGLVESVRRNWSVRTRDIRLFEIGIVFRAESGGGRPRETLRIGGVLSGARTPPHWETEGKAPDYDWWDLKHVVVSAAGICNPGAILTSGERGWVLEGPDGRRRGWGGEVDVDRPAWAGPVLGFELDVETPVAQARKYTPLPTTPPVERDLSLVLPPDATAGAVTRVMRDAAGPLLEAVRVFDEYRTKGDGRRSIAVRLVFRSRERTLQDREVDKSVARVLGVLKEQLGVERREA